jgi:ABC-type uncharacterized transport system ATPase subunit
MVDARMAARYNRDGPSGGIAMLTNIRIRNLKRFEDVSFELGGSVVFIGPNNSGKTTALQGLALWELGARQWLAKRGTRDVPEKRSGVTISRGNVLAIPVPDANLLWRDRHVREVERENGTQRTSNIRIDIIVDGVTAGRQWTCGLEFDYANEESFYCRPLRLGDIGNPERMAVPSEAGAVRIAYLPPMSGLAAIEPRWDPGRVNVLVGEGQTAQVLRNLCFQLYQENKEKWDALVQRMSDLFGAEIQAPIFKAERGEITMSYRERGGVELDITASGRGLQQTLLLLAYLYAHPGSVLLLDEPDAHLEVLRQRQTYALLTEVAEAQGSQLIAASHSEIVLNEAAGRDVVIAFVGKPHRIDDRGSQVLKALRDIGFDQYALAEQEGWVLYLEGSTDLAILQAFARTLGHEATRYLERPFVQYVLNQPQRARDHFFGLREAKPDLVGLAIFDRLDRDVREGGVLHETTWRRRELENYLTGEEVLLAYARDTEDPQDLFLAAEAARRETAMRESIAEVITAQQTLGRPDPRSVDSKASDDFLDPVFRRYFDRLGLPVLLGKTDYHRLASLIPAGRIDLEIVEKLDAIVSVAQQARPREQ